MRLTREKSGRASNKDEFYMTIRICMVLLSNFAGLAMLFVLAVLSAAQIQIHPLVQVWTVILALPLNSAMNPIFYTHHKLIVNIIKSVKGSE